MQSFQQATAPREFRTTVPIDGYVHKFRLEAREEAAAECRPELQAAPTVSLGALLGKFVLFALVLAGFAAAGARALI